MHQLKKKEGKNDDDDVKVHNFLETGIMRSK